MITQKQFEESLKILSKLIPNMVPIYIQWKLQDYVKFIRTKRDEMFQNDYKKKSRKFISHFGYCRSTLLSQYEKDLYAK